MILIGTSGYSFADWVGPFYPSGTPRGAMLEHYARHFPVTEINATYYRIPTPRSFAAMAQRTPVEFKFVVKAHRSMTHERDDLGANIDNFREALKPLESAGKLSGVLLQFPWSFKHGSAALDHLARVRGELPERSLFAEFRHASWIRDDVFAFLTDHRIGYCAVDEPDLPGLVPAVVRVTSSEGYVRFHGRNKATWWGDAEGDRYDYRYSKPELAEWVDKIRALDARTERTFVFFNNCHGGQAVDGARLMAQLLEIDLGGPRSEGT